MTDFIGKHSITLCDGRTYVYEIASHTQHFYGAYLIEGAIPARFTIFQEDMSHYRIDFRVRGIGDVKINIDTRIGMSEAVAEREIMWRYETIVLAIYDFMLGPDDMKFGD